MNCYDDLYVTSNHNYQFAENVDYLSNDIAISNECLVKCYKQLKYDISVIIPSTMSIRLKNIVWRRLYKNLNGLEEIDPTLINWYKDYDINWCYGPKYSNDELFPETQLKQSEQLQDDMDQESIDVTPTQTPLSYTVSNSSSDTLSDSDSLMSNNSSNSSITSNYIKQPYTKKTVKFNFIINSREIINGISIDYDFLDRNLLTDI